MEFFLILIAIAVYLGVWAFIANEFEQIANEKGYSGYFWWVFVLEIVGILMIIALPDKSLRRMVQDNKAIEKMEASQNECGYSLSAMAQKTKFDRNNQWKCKSCGTNNEISRSSCKDCGGYR